MSSDIKVYNGTPITWSPTGGSYAMSLQSLSTTTSGSAWQGAKGDLTTPRGARMAVRVQTQMLSSTTGTLEVWWAASPSSTAASNNPGGASGTDTSYAGMTGGTVATSKQQCTFIGVMTLETTTGVQTADIGILDPLLQYGSPIVVNLSTSGLGSSSANHVITFTPVIDQSQ